MNTKPEVKTDELSPSNPPNVDNLKTPQETVTSDNLVMPREPQWTSDSCPIEECEHKKAWRVKHNIPVHPGGRPCKFCTNKTEIMAIVDKYLKRCKEGENGKQIMPYLEELCLELDIDEDTIANWAQKKNDNDELEHPEFFGAYKKVRMYQRLRLQQRTMGRYNPTGAIFLLKVNHNMIESEKRIIAGDHAEPLEIKIIEEDRERYAE